MAADTKSIKVKIFGSSTIRFCPWSRALCRRHGASGLRRDRRWPVDAPFRFAYGTGSFRRHAAEARRLGLGLRVVRDRDLAFDVDVPDDLLALSGADALEPAVS